MGAYSNYAGGHDIPVIIKPSVAATTLIETTASRTLPGYILANVPKYTADPNK